MRGLKVIVCRNSENSDLRFDQPPLLMIDFISLLILILVSEFIFILQIERSHAENGENLENTFLLLRTDLLNATNLSS